MLKRLVIFTVSIIISSSLIGQNFVSAAEALNKRIILKVNDAGMFIDDAQLTTYIDPVTYAAPTVVDNRVLLPISNIIKEFGGTSTWEPAQKKITLNLNTNKVTLTLDSRKAYVNGTQISLDVAPTTISGRTMVPLRFVSDHLGLQLVWDQKNQIIALYQGDFDNIPTDYSGYFLPITSEDSSSGSSQDNSSQNTTSDKPISKEGVTIKVGDRVQFSFFYGEVTKIDGGRILVYWDSKDNLWLKDEDADFMAMLAGIKYKSSSWIDASDLTVEQ
ncbi:copper amine oxidase N-terminal domain-containing protein [Paenibacillus phocaensis]|uniref:copper amine oxidase N-terminal domain-containing protein n=1 Tax=Paenibacillus phocaensis TaxID=1776378 RepID=UPI000839BD5F|nr:copper amine oxidase N-terminal domain-containing protein [Paenibacillus phocaensis]